MFNRKAALEIAVAVEEGSEKVGTILFLILDELEVNEKEAADRHNEFQEAMIDSLARLETALEGLKS